MRLVFLLALFFLQALRDERVHPLGCIFVDVCRAVLNGGFVQRTLKIDDFQRFLQLASVKKK